MKRNISFFTAFAIAAFWAMTCIPVSGQESAGLFPVEVNGKCGFINKAGSMVITPQFEAALSGFHEGLAVVKVGGDQACYIAKDGKVVM